MKYPKVIHKIPELFEIIIDNDNLLDMCVHENISDLNVYKETKKRKTELIQSAEKFIKKQKGSDSA